MLARMSMPSAQSLRWAGLDTWGEALEAAGLIEGFKTARGFQSRAVDGHWCRSMFERAVDDFLSAHAIWHELEPAWPFHPLLNPGGRKRADWLLADGTFVEAAGMMSEAHYAAKMAEKVELAKASGIRIVVVEPTDATRLQVVFAPWMT
jgi:hypothetical protein